MTDLNPELIERARRVLVDEGADSEGGWHSWRCFDRERYPEPCDCTAEISRAILEDVAPLIAAQALEDAGDEVGRVREAIRLAQGVISPPHIAMILAGYDQAVGVIREQAAKLRGADQ